jgi:(2R)-3-sulfolactate dehydrogenase (NADP+)
MRLTMAQAETLVEGALRRAGANEVMARSTARALVLAEAQGLSSHGLGRVNQYCTHLGNGRADGAVAATVVRRKGGALLVDAGHGLAHAGSRRAPSDLRHEPGGGHLPASRC